MFRIRNTCFKKIYELSKSSICHSLDHKMSQKSDSSSVNIEINAVRFFQGRHKLSGPHKQRHKLSYECKIHSYDGRNGYKLSYKFLRTIVRRSTMALYEIRTIACGHFVRRTSVFYTRTIACAVACGDPNDFFSKNSCNKKNLTPGHEQHVHRQTYDCHHQKQKQPCPIK